ncbi:MAG: hypothetical protein E7393_02430 [Ruminococcaceae bacterium]|nr:hypothetical protein [Oscillospiraceae bacterium]
MNWEVKAMTLKTFLPKAGIVRYQLKRFWWVSALYTLLLFLVGPFIIMSRDKTQMIEKITRFPHLAGAELHNNGGAFIFLIGAAVILGVCMFRYMQEVRSATLFHALPVTRNQLYISALFSGFILLALPIIVNGCIYLCMSLGGGYFQILPPHMVADWVGSQLLTGIATLFFCMLVGVLTGSSVGQFIFTFALCGLPVGIVALGSYLLDGWLFGFTSSGIDATLEFLIQITPIFFPQFLTNANSILWIPVLEGIYILLFAGLGLWLYGRRDVERAGDVAAFPFIRPLFLYGVTLCGMLAGTAFISEVIGIGRHADPNLFVLLFFALLSYVIAKILLAKSFRILPYYKGYVVFGILVLIAFFAINGNWMGYGTTVPSGDIVEKAYIGDYYINNWAEQRTYGYEGVGIFSDTTGVDSVRALQQNAVHEGKMPRLNGDSKRTVYFSYKLTSGACMTRAYEIEETELFTLFSTDAAKDSMYPNFRLYPEQIRYITLPDVGADIYGEEKEELIACVRADLERLTYQEIIGRTLIDDEPKATDAKEELAIPVDAKAEQMRIRSLEVAIEPWEEPITSGPGVFMQNNGKLWFTINLNFTETIGWLENNGYGVME